MGLVFDGMAWTQPLTTELAVRAETLTFTRCSKCSEKDSAYQHKEVERTATSEIVEIPTGAFQYADYDRSITAAAGSPFELLCSQLALQSLPLPLASSSKTLSGAHTAFYRTAWGLWSRTTRAHSIPVQLFGDAAHADTVSEVK